jgi:DNA mismatch repair protein MutS
MVGESRSTILNSDRIPQASLRQSGTSTSDSAAFTSILFEREEDRCADDAARAPDFFVDLNCDQIVNTVVAGKDEYDLRQFFYGCLKRVDAIWYRHEVMRDLEHADLHASVSAFATEMRGVREGLRQSKKASYKEQKEAWFLDAIAIYCKGVNELAAGLAAAAPKSRGFIRLRQYLDDYVSSAKFGALLSETERIKAELASIEYCVVTRGNSFTVRKYEGEFDYSVDVEKTFERFKQGAVKDYRVTFRASQEMNHIEAKILEFVAQLNPEVFAALASHCGKNGNFVDRILALFDREVQFYIALAEYLAPLRSAGLPFCYPRLSIATAEVYARDCFDIALAHKLVASGSSVVCNDFHLTGKERILVISGPNQGGKTTFARAFGQLHYLASIGCPVPGAKAQLFLFDHLFTHFEKEERVENLRGKLEDDLVRIHGILAGATPRSIIVMNEIFTSTTIQDEVFLSTKVMTKLVELDALCVWVTFVDELAAFGPQTVSLVSTVVPDNPAMRTFRLVRRPADGLAYAMAIAQKYNLTYEAIMERVKS